MEAVRMQRKTIKTFKDKIGTHLNQGKYVKTAYKLPPHSSKKYNVLMIKGFYPELDGSELLDKSSQTCYMQLI